MKRIAFAMLSVAAGILVLTGCSKKDGAWAKKGDEKIVLTVWESLNGPDEFIMQAGEAYTKTHPNVEIKFENVEIGDASGEIFREGPSGAGPDLFAAPHDKLSELVNGGHVLPTVNASSVKKSVLGTCSQALTYDGKMYGYPVSVETYALFYNKDLISESDVPKTWDELAKWVKAFNAKNSEKFGFVMDVGNGYYTILFTTAGGNRLFGSSGTDTSSSCLNTASAVSGMKIFQSLREFLNVPSDEMDTARCNEAFLEGKAAMYITGSWDIRNFKDAGLNFGVAPLPSLPGDRNPSTSFSGTRAMFVSSYSDYPLEAADFAQFLISASMQQLRFDLTGTMPSIDTPVSSPYTGGFFKQLDHSFSMPSVPEMAKFWETMAYTSKRIWDGADVQEELDACDEAIVSK